jgi:hypothetical protein
MLLSYSTQAQTADSNQKKLRGFAMSQNFQAEGRKYSYGLATSDVENTPSWNPSREDPPLPLRSALSIAQANIGRYVKDVSDWEVDEVSLKQMDIEKWIYEIAFACKKRECIEKGYLGSIPILIKMDGMAVEPKLEADEKRSGQ